MTGCSRPRPSWSLSCPEWSISGAFICGRMVSSPVQNRTDATPAPGIRHLSLPQCLPGLHLMVHSDYQFAHTLMTPGNLARFPPLDGVERASQMDRTYERGGGGYLGPRRLQQLVER